MRRLAPALVALTCLVACGGGPVETVVLVSIDSLRADHVGAYGYPKPTTPTIDRLAERGVVFERAYSTTSWTLPSHLAMLTGLDNLSHGVRVDERTLPTTIPTLAEQLSAAGIETVGFFAGPYLHPTYGFGRGFDRYVDCRSPLEGEGQRPDIDQLVESHGDVTNPILLREVERWLTDRTPGGRTFVFLHMWDVHFDYIPPPEYLEQFDATQGVQLEPPYFTQLEVGMPEEAFEHVVARYDGEIRYTDDTLGAILDALEAAGLLDRAAVIVTSDHGEEFLEHGRFGHGGSLYEEVLKIPLVLARTHRAPRVGRVSEPVSLIDLYPTVCDLFGGDCAYDGPGVSLERFFDSSDPTPGRSDALGSLFPLDGGAGEVALVREEDKVISHPDHGVIYSRPGEPETTDGSRRVDAKAALEALAALREREKAAKALGRLHPHDPARKPELDEPTREHLRELGYAE